MEIKTYISGFDMVKLFGSVLVALGHMYLLDFVPLSLIGFCNELVPVFFLIAGYLMYHSITKREKPLCYVVSYLAKYGSIFLFFEFIALLFHYVQIYKTSGIFMYKDLIFILCTLPLRSPKMYQLWFIPSLMAGVLINTPIFIKKADRAAVLPMILVILFTIANTQYDVFAHISVSRLASRYIQGIFFIYAGMWIAKKQAQIAKFKLRYLVMACVLVTAMELIAAFCFENVYSDEDALTLTSLFWGFLIFLAILRLEKPNLQKYHRFITIFSGITFFLHVTEDVLLMHLIENGFVRFWIAMVFNATLTFVLLKRQRSTHDI